MRGLDVLDVTLQLFENVRIERERLANASACARNQRLVTTLVNLTPNPKVARHTSDQDSESG